MDSHPHPHPKLDPHPHPKPSREAADHLEVDCCGRATARWQPSPHPHPHPGADPTPTLPDQVYHRSRRATARWYARVTVHAWRAMSAYAKPRVRLTPTLTLTLTLTLILTLTLTLSSYAKPRVSDLAIDLSMSDALTHH